MKKKHIINYFNLDLDTNDIRILLIIIVILVIILIFRKLIGIFIEKLLLFSIIFLLFLCLSKNIFITFICTIIIFLILNLMMNYNKKNIEKFEDIKSNELTFDKNIFATKEVKEASSGIKDLLKKLNGGIELKEDDLKETGILNIDTEKYKDDKIPNPLKQAQKETYELIDTVNTLKDTITTLAPVLKEGKKLIDIFQNLKL